jgi:hypothetical protein
MAFLLGTAVLPVVLKHAAIVKTLKIKRKTSRVSGRTETKTYGSTADMLAFQILTGRKSLW